METTEVKQKFAVILAADAGGYMCLLRGAKEEALGAPAEHRAIIDEFIEGRILSTAGDSVIAGSDVWSRRYVAPSRSKRSFLYTMQNSRGTFKLRFRIGIYVGELMVERNDWVL